ncbi:MAG TPA: glycosyltransferase family 9 protein [Pirellulales bacterium]|jgi:lipopolysaccharide heptosyltransferase I
MPQGNPRILIVRLSAIGDCLHTLPVLCALRDQMPGAFLTWVVEGRSGDLLREHPALDELVIVPRGWLKSPRLVWQLRQKLRQLRFDIAIDVQGLTKSAVAAWLSGAPRRIGMKGVDGREISSWINNELVEPQDTHVVDRNIELLKPLGIDVHTPRFGLPRTSLEESRADQIVRTAEVTSGFAIINPGAGWPSKLWPAERFAAVARFLGHDHGLPSLVLWAGAKERAMAESIAAASEGHALMAPPTSLPELVSLARRARLFISSDTGPLHIAAAVGTPCVAMFGPMPAERNGPYGSGHITLQNMRLEGNSRSRRTAGPESMLSISVDDVVKACGNALRRRAQAA